MSVSLSAGLIHSEDGNNDSYRPITQITVTTATTTTTTTKDSKKIIEKCGGFEQFREKIAGDTCSICLEETPNMAALCCGSAVHATCMTRWLNEKKSCHQCRTKIQFRPNLPIRYKKGFPEKPSSDTCSICLEETSNMAILCCGAAVHISCMTRRLTKKKSCHQCRAKIPFRPTPPNPTAAVAAYVLPHTPHFLRNGGYNTTEQNHSQPRITDWDPDRPTPPSPTAAVAAYVLPHTPHFWDPDDWDSDLPWRTMYNSDVLYRPGLLPPHPTLTQKKST